MESPQQAAILSISELAFAFLLDVTVLHERTTFLAASGTATVLVGCILVAAPAQKARAAIADSDTSPQALAQATVEVFDPSQWIEGGAVLDVAGNVQQPKKGST